MAPRSFAQGKRSGPVTSRRWRSGWNGAAIARFATAGLLGVGPRPRKPEACQMVAGGRAKRHPRIARISHRPRRGRRTLASLQDARLHKPATGGLRYATTPGHSRPTLRVGGFPRTPEHPRTTKLAHALPRGGRREAEARAPSGVVSSDLVGRSHVPHFWFLVRSKTTITTLPIPIKPSRTLGLAPPQSITLPLLCRVGART